MESFSRVVSYFSKFLQFYSDIRHIIHALLYSAYHSRPTVLSTNKHNKSEDTAVKAYSINIIRLTEYPQIALK